jgi:hypothetical protein
MVHLPHQVNRGWRRLPPADLEDFLRQSTADHRPTSLGERQQLGRMEKRLAKVRAKLRRREVGI